MELELLIIVSGFIIGYGVISGRIQKTIFTAPMIFVVLGIVLGEAGLIELEVENELINLIAELTLILVLFTDASRINLAGLIKEHGLPMRMLSVGLTLTIFVGTLLAVALFDEFSIWEAAILAIILAPTDAALAQAVLNSERVPVRIRQALNVESGLNDGLALPVLLLFISLASAETQPASYWMEFIALQLILGPIVGVAVGFFGGRAVSWATRSGWMDEAFQRLSAIGLALLAYSLAEFVGGNGFVAAFMAGLTIGNTSRAICHCLYEFAEAEGQLLMLFTFMIFGAVMVPPELGHITPQIIIYGLLSLTLIRMIPVAISLIGTKLMWETTVFLGWFGPRGVASIIYGLLLLERSEIAAAHDIFTVMVITALMSVFAHGFTALPGVSAYARSIDAMDEDDMPEHETVTEMPLRYS